MAAACHVWPDATGEGGSRDVAEAGTRGGTAGSVSYLTSNVALSFEKICLDSKTAIYVTLFF
jgi:hypothetical protein